MKHPNTEKLNRIRKRLYVLESRLLSVVTAFEFCRLILITEKEMPKTVFIYVE